MRSFVITWSRHGLWCAGNVRCQRFVRFGQQPAVLSLRGEPIQLTLERGRLNLSVTTV